MKTSGSGSPARAFAGRFAIALVVGAVLMGTAVAGVNREVGKKLDRIPKIELTTAPVPPGGANYLVVGSDSRAFVSNEAELDAFGDPEDEVGQRSDTIMVVHVEPKAERTFVVSFPRDLWVSIPNHGSAKINAAYGYDQQTLIDTLKQNFDVDVNHYIEVNFKTFTELVDSLGEVVVYTPYPARDTKTLFELPNSGCTALNGAQSLQYVRSRSFQYLNPETGRWVDADPIPDFARIARQQEFMRKLAGLAVQKSLQNPFTANLVADKVINGLKVDDAFDKSSVFGLLDAFRTLNPDDTTALEMVTLPATPGFAGDQSVVYANTTDPLFGQIIERLRTFDETPKPVPLPSEITVRVVNATNRADLAVAVTKELEDLGFDTVAPVEGSGERIPGIDVRVTQDQARKGKLVLRYIDPTAQLSVVDPSEVDPGDVDPGDVDPGDVDPSDVDVTIVLGKAFERIAVPADALPTPPEAAPEAAPDAVPATEGVPATVAPVAEVAPAPAPLDVPTTTTTLPPSLPEPAPRFGC